MQGGYHTAIPGAQRGRLHASVDSYSPFLDSHCIAQSGWLDTWLEIRDRHPLLGTNVRQ